ncbi:MAG: folate-binding protein [Azoarcus sp.]|jgi:folate-binding protein YgfZ|nr:folate-binding protein [Azoarcus sp.]
MSNWTDYLARHGARFDTDNFGMDFGVPHANADALASGAVAVPLVHLGLVHATGDEVAGFLHNMFSNEVAGLAADAVQWTSFNTAQGRMLANFLLWRDDDGYSLAPAADLAPALLNKLSLYILRSKVRLVRPPPERALIGLAGQAAGDCLARAGLPVPESDMRQAVSGGGRTIRLGSGLFIVDLAVAEAALVFDALLSAGAVESGTASWYLAAIRAGLPLVTAATQEAFVAQMLNFELIGGISFSKGCYPGQEIVVRTQYLGKPKRRTYRLGFSVPSAGVSAGVALYAPESGEQPVGVVVNFASLPWGGEALAVLQSACAAAGGEIRVGAPDGPCAEVLDLPYEVPS